MTATQLFNSAPVFQNRRVFHRERAFSPGVDDAHPMAPLNELPRLRRSFAPRAIMLIGRRGQGKTLMLTAFGKLQQERYHRMAQKARVFANYWVTFADHKSPFILDGLFDPTSPSWRELNDGILLLDEIQTAASNRRWQSHSNISLAQYLTQMRKRRLEVCFTTQFPQVIDRTLLYQVDLFCESELFWHKRQLGVLLHVHDYWGQYTGNTGRRHWPPAKDEADWTRWYWPLHTFFSQYSTDEFVVPAYFNEEQRGALVGREWEGRGRAADTWAETLAPAEADILLTALPSSPPGYSFRQLELATGRSRTWLTHQLGRLGPLLVAQGGTGTSTDPLRFWQNGHSPISLAPAPPSPPS